MTMGGLGNVRRGGRSPPLLIAALIACILVLGFNYWVSSSRNLELQTKLYELDGKVRRGVAEQEASEVKRSQFQEEIQRQKEQIIHIESLYKRQLEGEQNTCTREKAALQQNVSSSTKSIQDLQGQLNQLVEDLGKLQMEVQSCHGNINTLNNKLTYDMTHCNSQVLAQKELCDERVLAVKKEIQDKMEKLLLHQPEQEEQVKVDTEQKDLNSNDSPDANEIVKNAEVEDSPVDLDAAKEPFQAENHSLPPTPAPKNNVHPPPVEAGEKEKQEEVEEEEEKVEREEEKVEREEEKVEEPKLEKDLLKNMDKMDILEGREEHIDDEGMEGMFPNNGEKEQKHEDHHLGESDDYIGEDHEAALMNRPGKDTDKGMEDELADYNGDDDNEGEFEADKQAELAQL